MANLIPPRFKVVIDYERCRKCKRCVINCGFGVYSFADRVIPDHKKCVSCQRCVAFCPEEAITIIENPNVFRPNSYWTMEDRINIMKQASSSGMLLTGMGNDRPYKNYFDHLLIDACQVTNPSIDPLREPMELTTYLGKKPDAVKVKVENGKVKLDTQIAPQIKLDTPIIFSPMSYGSISLNAHKALARAAKECGILMNTGEGGLHKELYPYKDWIIVQVASGRFGVNQEYLDHSAVVEIKIGQGAKPGIGGHLPGEKVNREVSETRMIPEGTDALSPAPHHDIYSIEDLAQLIYALKEATHYEKPVSVKIAAVHNVAAIASGIARAGADIIYIDGFRGGTGAAPTVIRDHIGIPIELAIAAVDDRLRAEGIRNSVSIVAAGGIRHSGDVAKAIALGADAVAIGTAALIAMGCHVCQMCHTGNCSWGIATQRPELTQRLDPDWAAQQLINLVKSWSLELKEILGALGLNAIESLRGSRERLRGIGLTDTELAILGVKHAGR
ncbi:glutamate synthase-related protein [Carboxydothermus hydrogenoformans]|uniref:glutamate synthase (NADPH) n=1 Tax=Carboxydothermus hydrogenoformans (strain ATCC BAA-161 / DSM 6008 / Z-2901) TaxID=246194 RepID=Q3AE73_CARHZ|nr:glutamate synthase-related protein [Carboxydothermus hydrogenoformans]ABB15827.1 glutamate synthase, homolog [Carboxydothermus hydrogenoformans Z-2901]